MQKFPETVRETGDQHEALLYRLLVKDLKDYAIFQIDRDGRMASWNAGVERQLGYTEPEFLGLPFAQIFIPDDVAAGIPEWELREAMQSGHSEDERWHRRKDGTEFFVDGMVTALYREEELIGFSKVMRDATDRRRAQEALQQSHEELANFAAIVSHDLRTPLRTIHAYTQLLARHQEGQLDAEAQEFVRYILQGTEAMGDLIETLLQYARAGEESPVQEFVDLAAVIESVWREQLYCLVEETGARLHVVDRPVVEANAAQLKQIFQNLLENAMKYRGRETPRIEIRAQPRKDNWLIIVQDNGRGFDPQKAAHIFEPLQRLRDNQEEGSGIGLAICKKIVKRLGGQIWADATPGRGATFSFTLPRSFD